IAIDMQDMASRYTTYLSTQLEVQAAASEAGIPVVILDRPNPLADIRLEGNVLELAFQSFVGAHPITIRHGMTAGELGSLVAAERGWPAPTVVPVEGWRRTAWYDETGLPWVLPSPNMPSLETLTLYNGTCLVEGTNLSEGRGTTMPFRFVGSPTLDADALIDDLRDRALPGIALRRVSFTPMFSKHAQALCHGLEAYAADRNALDAAAFGIHLLHALRRHDPEFAWVKPNHDERPFFIDLLLGSDRPRLRLDEGASPDEVMAGWQDDQGAFARRREPFLLYE
ncbi:MAG: exo-beta-N-acetylmuramidase NamZ family protein, partial [Thermomicrobiales bacterium]